MQYKELAEFIGKKMRMSHIYQPVMLMRLLENNGKCHEVDIAKDLVSHDQSQIEYYTKITNNMVGKVLRNHRVVSRNRDTKEYSLADYESMTLLERKHLIELCRQRLIKFTEDRGKTVFDHRRRTSGYVSGTIKYEILKRARFCCELCGISAYKKALEVDHIIPRSHGGSDDKSNLQALCYSCNAMKRDRDDTDFRDVRASYEYREKGCLFCEINKEEVVGENELAYVIRDGFPVTEYHSLIIPKRHVATYFDLGQAEINAISQILQKTKNVIQEKDSTVSGFNIGINAGKSAGQTVFHCHTHLIPRRDGDVENPRGGVRHIIPGKGSY
jgi:diadenosine tetraphosphate (Ap4A) HIT family hydrolase